LTASTTACRVLSIPDTTKHGLFTPVEFGIRVTNNTESFFYFPSNFGSMFPEMIAPNGQIMQTGLLLNFDWTSEE
jgi:hypothetical protein